MKVNVFELIGKIYVGMFVFWVVIGLLMKAVVMLEGGALEPASADVPAYTASPAEGS